MHELGHTLNLHHGGFEDANCKPNYVSIMNYDLQSGIPRVRGGSILDYSPARTNLDGTGHRSSEPKLDEEDLNENGALDASDTVNRTAFTNNAGTKVKQSLSYDYVNWNGDTDDFYPGGGDTEVEGNIDTSGSDGNPKACTNDDDDDEMEPANDWLYVSLSFHGFGDASDGAIRPEENTVPTSQELDSMRQELNRTDLQITQTDSPDPVAAGTSVTYTVNVKNVGPNPADSVTVTDTLPTEATFVSSSTPCARAAQVLTCQLGSMEPATDRSFTVTASVPADLVYTRGGPVTITNAATVVNGAGPESDPTNNTSTEQTRVIAVADLSVTATTTTAPLEVLIGQTGSASLSATVANGGPSSPIDAVLTTTASADSRPDRGAGLIDVGGQRPGRGVTSVGGLLSDHPMRRAWRQNRHPHDSGDHQERSRHRPGHDQQQPDGSVQRGLRRTDRDQCPTRRFAQPDQPQHRRDPRRPDHRRRRVRPAVGVQRDPDRRDPNTVGASFKTAQHGHPERRFGDPSPTAPNRLLRAQREDPRRRPRCGDALQALRLGSRGRKY